MIHVIEKAYNEIDDCHNINEFLKKIVKIQGLPEFDITRFLEFNREEFFQTELGKKLIEAVNHFKAEMLTDDPHIERFQVIIDTIFLALNQFYHVDCKVVLREDGYDIVANNIEDLMYKYRQRSNYNE